MQMKGKIDNSCRANTHVCVYIVVAKIIRTLVFSPAKRVYTYTYTTVLQKTELSLSEKFVCSSMALFYCQMSRAHFCSAKVD